MPHANGSPYSSELDVAVKAAREAGALLRDQQRELLNVRHKGVIDLVTDADLASERLIAERILAAFPDDQLLAEEGTESATETASGRLWIIDPLDGTTNYAHNYPLYAVSIALEVDGVVQVGAVYVPVLDEMFATGRGCGATLNGTAIHVSETDDLIDAMLCTGFAYDPDVRPANLAHWSAFAGEAQAVRRDGAAALDLCFVACGRFDGFWERELYSWDVAAAALLINEAGGQTTDYHGGELDIHAREVVASNGRIHEQMLQILARNL